MLDNISDRLTANYERLTGPRRPGTGQPGDAMLGYLREGVEIAEKAIDEVKALAGICSRVLGDSFAYEIDRFEDAALDAKEEIFTALLAFDASETARPFGAQSRAYFDSARQLRAMAKRCKTLARHLRGPQELQGDPEQ